MCIKDMDFENKEVIGDAEMHFASLSLTWKLQMF